MSYKYIIFDLDGTVLDTAPGIMKNIYATLDKMGLSVPDSLTRESFIGPPLLVGLREIPGIENQRDEEALELYNELFWDIGVNNEMQFEGMDAVLKTLVAKGYKLGLATLKLHKYISSEFKRAGYTDYFTVINGAVPELNLDDKITLIKKTVAEFGADISECIMIGDSEFDGLGAKACDMDFMAVTYGYGIKSKDDLTDIPYVAIANSPQEILENL